MHFDSEADAQQAVGEMNGYEYKGFKLKVEMAGTRGQKKKVPESANRKPFCTLLYGLIFFRSSYFLNIYFVILSM